MCYTPCNAYPIILNVPSHAVGALFATFAFSVEDRAFRADMKVWAQHLGPEFALKTRVANEMVSADSLGEDIEESVDAEAPITAALVVDISDCRPKMQRRCQREDRVI